MNDNENINIVISRYLLNKNPIDEMTIYHAALKAIAYPLRKINHVGIYEIEDIKQEITARVFSDLPMFDSKLASFEKFCQLVCRSQLHGIFSNVKATKRKLNLIAQSHEKDLDGQWEQIDPPTETDHEKLFDDTEELLQLRKIANKLIAENLTPLEEKIMIEKTGDLTDVQISLRLNIDPKVMDNANQRASQKIKSGLRQPEKRKRKIKSLKLNPIIIYQYLDSLEKFHAAEISTPTTSNEYRKTKDILTRLFKNSPEVLHDGNIRIRWERIINNKYPHRRKMSASMIQKVRELKDSGMSHTEIAKIIGTSPKNAQAIYLRHSRHLQTPDNANQTPTVDRTDHDRPSDDISDA